MLDSLSDFGECYQSLENQAVRCLACAHSCILKPGQHGICQMRFNRDGKLRVPFGYVAGAQVDPIEKKPFAHFLPGSNALTFGMLGCNFHCGFCQNWVSSQAGRDPSSKDSLRYIQHISPEQIVEHALENGAQVIASSYNEPLISTEWAVAIFKLARRVGIKTVYVSNGFAGPEVLDYLCPHLDGYKVDLKTMQDAQYKALGGRLQPVLDTIRRMHEMGLWVEVVTLVIPGFNDSSAELWDAARTLAGISLDIPWHVTAFHPDYRMNDCPSTPPQTLQQAAEIGQEAGLHYVYAGNLPGRVGSLEDTFCPVCQASLIRRRGYTLSEYHLTAEGKCPKCGSLAAGVWTEKPQAVRLWSGGRPHRIVH